MLSLCTPFELLNHLTDFHDTCIVVMPLLISIINSRADAQTCASGAALASILGSEVRHVNSLGIICNFG